MYLKYCPPLKILMHDQWAMVHMGHGVKYSVGHMGHGSIRVNHFLLWITY